MGTRWGEGYVGVIGTGFATNGSISYGFLHYKFSHITKDYKWVKNAGLLEAWNPIKSEPLTTFSCSFYYFSWPLLSPSCSGSSPVPHDGSFLRSWEWKCEESEGMGKEGTYQQPGCEEANEPHEWTGTGPVHLSHSSSVHSSLLRSPHCHSHRIWLVLLCLLDWLLLVILGFFHTSPHSHQDRINSEGRETYGYQRLGESQVQIPNNNSCQSILWTKK